MPAVIDDEEMVELTIYTVSVKTSDATGTQFLVTVYKCFEGAFTLGRFGSIKTNSSAIALLVWFV